MSRSYSLQQIATHLGLRVLGDDSCVIKSAAPLLSAGAGQISFLCDKQYRNQLEATGASAVLLSEKHAAGCRVPMLISANPSLDLVRLLHFLYPVPDIKPGIAASAVVAEDAVIDSTACVQAGAVIDSGARVGANSSVGAGCYLGPNTAIGDACKLHPRVTVLAESQIGSRVVIHPGAVIGSDGFGNALNEKNRWVKVPQLGSVRIGDDVEIGANTTIDRGALEDTVIENGVRLDNQIQIGHNVKIGAHTAVAGCTGIAGSTVLGKHCMVGGGCCINGHLTICDGAMFTGMSMITKSVSKPGVYSSGTPAMPNRDWHRHVVQLKRLGNLVKRVTQLEREKS